MQSTRDIRELDELAVSDHRTRYKGVTRTMSAYTPVVAGTGPRAAVQRFGAFLAGMIMPNLGAFIAWGLLTAITIQNGWINLIARAVGAGPAGTGTVAFANQVSVIVGPIIVFLLPILIGYTG